MKPVLWLLLALSGLAQSCSNAQDRPTGSLLPAADFSQRLKSSSDAVLLDVRSPEEFAKGHLPAARNINWKGDDFQAQIAPLDQSKPVFVYCLSGARSAAAAQKMRSLGFQNVVELDGGILKWRAANLPETHGDAAQVSGISAADYQALLQSDKLVLVDFYADWCAPCKKMAPYLEEIKRDMAERVTVVRINADDNQSILKSMHIDALPVLLIYKDGKEVWRNAGFVEKEVVLGELGKN